MGRKTVLRTRITRKTMDFKSTIFIFGIALIFILPLVFSSPISGEETEEDLEGAFGEEALERVKRAPAKQPGSQGYVKQNGRHNDKFKGGNAGQWHIRDQGHNPHIKLGKTRFTLVKNNPERNKIIAMDALNHLDSLPSKPGEPELTKLRNSILYVVEHGVIQG